jgi:toxin ParE1/3/4
MYKLSNLAAEDFERIFEYTLLNFGVKQADDYTVSMHNALLAITEQPLMGHECPEIAKELRRYNHHKHAIFYKKQPYGIYILRILHQQMEPLRHFYLDTD